MASVLRLVRPLPHVAQKRGEVVGEAPTTTPQECVAFVGFSSPFPVYGFRVIFDLPRAVSSVHPLPLCPGSPSYALRRGGEWGGCRLSLFN